MYFFFKFFYFVILLLFSLYYSLLLVFRLTCRHLSFGISPSLCAHFQLPCSITAFSPPSCHLLSVPSRTMHLLLFVDNVSTCPRDAIPFTPINFLRTAPMQIYHQCCPFLRQCYCSPISHSIRIYEWTLQNNLPFIVSQSISGNWKNNGIGFNFFFTFVWT